MIFNYHQLDLGILVIIIYHFYYLIINLDYSNYPTL